MRRLALVLVIALVSALAPAADALAQPAARAAIVGGSTAAPGSWPSAAFVADLQGNMAELCTGTVVAPRVVLTAAHCVTDSNASDYRVVTGSLDWANGPTRQESRVVQTSTFPNWEPRSLFGDAALLILSAPTTAPALPLATVNDIALLRPPRSLQIAGWGQTAITDQNPPTVLRDGSIMLQPTSYCGGRSADLGTAFQPAAMLCAIDARDFTVGVCHGDSGGPLVATRPDGSPVQVGITSAGEGRCSVRFPGFFTRVDVVSNWVNAWIAAVASSQSSGPITPPALPPASHATPPLGRLSNGEAGGDVRQAILSRMGSRFRGATHYRSKCVRQSASRVKCNVAWTKSGTAYKGAVTVFLRYDAVQRLVLPGSSAKFKMR